ncbi:MAG: ribbon-helix-helix domain-containing protein [Desulfuromonadales bacterium]|nr:ribbon-helix-helix domain-containing protein [Desulfuromonadales bacterium]
MGKLKVAVTLDETILREVDRLVTRKVFANRSRAVETALREKLERLSHTRLARECAALDPVFEQSLAEEGVSEDLAAWPKY